MNGLLIKLKLISMNNLPTAEEWLNDHKELSKYDVASYDEGGYLGVDEYKLYQIMTEFAKLHVQKALEEASENAKIFLAKDWIRKEETIYHNQLIGPITVKADKDSILNAYPLENIK